jgi:hypothetical protein
VVKGSYLFASVSIPEASSFVKTSISNSFTVGAKGYSIYYLLMVEGSYLFASASIPEAGGIVITCSSNGLAVGAKGYCIYLVLVK